MATRFKLAFGALVLAQAAHSVEEYIGRLWESFPPARLLTGLVSQDREWSFVALTILLIAFGLWCLLWPVRRGWPSAVYLAWAWVIVEIINGIVHPLWTLHEGGYTPGVATAPVLLALAVYLGYQLRNVGKVKTTADHPFVISSPAIGFLNLKGKDGERLRDADASILAPLFSRVEKSTTSAPNCQVLFVYCDLDATGKVLGSSQSIRDLIKSAGAYVAVVASENPAEAYIQSMKVRNDWSANVAMVLDRKSDKLAMFFRRLFEAMLRGESMLMAWVALAPQIPGHDDPDAPGTIMAAEAGHVTFGK